MFRYLLFLCVFFSCHAAPPITHPSNPNYYRYMPDENTPYQPLKRTDDRVEERIRINLRKWLAGGFDGHIKIEVNNGDVTLYGSVPTQWDKDAIENRVKGTYGVNRVNNQITVQADVRNVSW